MVKITFEEVHFDDIREVTRSHLESLPGRIDSFLEGHILGSMHFRMRVDGSEAGFTSIHSGGLLTQFVVHPSYRLHGQRLFAEARRCGGVTSAFVPTCDEYYLALALDDYRELAKQAYFFALDSLISIPERFRVRVAHSGDAALILGESGAFFDPIDQSIAAGNLFVTELDGESVGFGVIEPSTVYDRVASIGMFTIEQYRGIGVGTATIAGLIRESQSRGDEPIAGCWYYNHLSKRTLERAGMYARSRLLKFGYDQAETR